MMRKFDDFFSQQAVAYAQNRPRYPEELFTYLSSLAPEQEMAWDCGTGNGQAALELAQHFDHVVATDASYSQISQAFPHEQIHYWVGRAESLSMPAQSVDLVTVGTAVHWFDLDVFYAEVQRILKPEGVLGVWTYYMPTIDGHIDAILAKYKDDILAGYWSPKIRYIEEGYTTLPFPFIEIAPPALTMTTHWNLGQVIGFLDSWSGTQKYVQDVGQHPIEPIWEVLNRTWGDAEEQKELKWPLYIRIGKM